MMDEIELLAPAGSFDSLKAAVFAGADAVYLGGEFFGARAYADNFDSEGLKRAIDFAHIHRKKIYLTLNTLLKEDEISSQLGNFLLPLYREGVDAVIVQDLGVLSFVHDNFPMMKIHASTQMGIATVYGVEALMRMGVQRVILPRELSLEEIREISTQTQSELEMFVHGAMCYSYSGQCLMSGMIGGRSGNRGRCAGPCRLPWNLKGEERVSDIEKKGGYSTKKTDGIVNEGQAGKRNARGTGKQRKQSDQGNPSGYPGREIFLNRSNERYLLNMKDLCTIENMQQYLEAGVSSLKIEGRMKSPEYVAGTVEIYRKYLDRCLERKSRKEEKSCVDAVDLQRLTDLYSRGSFTDGYLHRHNGRSMLALDGPAERIRENEYICELRKKYLETEKKEKIYGIVKVLKHKNSSFQLKYAGIEVCVYGPVPEEAQSRPLTRETVKEKFSRMGNTPFLLEKLDIYMDDGVFLDLKTMNEMRRACVEKLTEEILLKSRRKEPDIACDIEKTKGKRTVRENKSEPLYTALISSLNQWKPVLTSPDISDIYVEEYLLKAEQIPKLAEEAAERGKRLFLAMPHIFRKQAYDALEENEGQKLEILRKTDGIGYLVRNPDECEYLLRYAPKPMVFDYTCWRMNHRARKMWEQMGQGYALRTTVSPELNEKELLHSPVEGEEFLIYGKIPVMISANCLRKTTVGCSAVKSERKAFSDTGSDPITLMDRKNVTFDVQTVCRYCYNLIYNSVPLSLNVEEDRLLRFGFGAFRYQFTTETAQETADILKRKPVGKRTRGHFYRGVE